MTEQEFDHCCRRLRGMQDYEGWSDLLRENHLLAWGKLDVRYVASAIKRAIKTLDRRPSPARVRRLAAEAAAGLPDEGALFGEFWHKAVCVGYEDACWTHPLLAGIAARLGGWRVVRAMHPHLDFEGRERLRRRFMEALESLAEWWYDEVANELERPEEEWDALYRIGMPAEPFQPQVQLPSEYQDSRALPGPREPLSLRIPDSVRQMIKSVAKERSLT